MRLIKNAVSVGSFTALSRMAGFVREWLQAHFIGASVVSDALNYAISFPSFFRRIFAEGAFNASFVPLFASTLAGDGFQEARRFAQTILTLLLGALIVIVLSVVLFADTIMPFFLPGFKGDPDKIALTISFTKITFPFLLFISITAFFSGILNSFERFIAAASSPAVGNLAIIFSLVFFTDFGVKPGNALALGVLACGIVQFFWVFIPSLKYGIGLSLKRPRLSPNVKKFFKRLLPAALGASVFQINLIMDMMLSSYLPTKCFSYLKYADRFSQLPLSIIGTAISTALLPTLSKQFRKNTLDKARNSQNRAIEFCLFFSIPAMLGLIFMADMLIESFYLHGRFQTCDIHPTAVTLMALSAGLPAYVMVKVFSTTFFSRGDTRTPVVFAMISVGINFLMNLLLIWSLAQVGMALATAISSWINALMLGIFLRKRGLLTLDVKLKAFIPRILFTASILAAYLYGFHPYLEQHLRQTDLWTWIQTILLIAAAAGVYVTTAYLMKVFTWHRVKEHMSDADE